MPERKFCSVPVLYTKPNCPWCEAALQFFSNHNITIIVCDVQASQADFEAMVQISGQRKTPTLKYGAFVVSDFSVEELKQALESDPQVKAALGIP